MLFRRVGWLEDTLSAGQASNRNKHFSQMCFTSVSHRRLQAELAFAKISFFFFDPCLESSGKRSL